MAHGQHAQIGSDEGTLAAEQKSSALRRAFEARRSRLQDDQPVEVEAGLFVGGVSAAQNHEALLAHGVTHILCLSATSRHASAKAHRPDLFEYKDVLLQDGLAQRIVPHFAECFEFIDRARGKETPCVDGRRGGVLVHCFQGKSRSAAVIVGYLMRRNRAPFLTVLESLREKRPTAQPNAAFSAELLAFERGGWKLSSTPVVDLGANVEVAFVE